MKKSEAIAMLGGTTSEAAQAIGITVQAINNWPDVLSPRIADRVHAAASRLKNGDASDMTRQLKLIHRLSGMAISPKGLDGLEALVDLLEASQPNRTSVEPQSPVEI